MNFFVENSYTLVLIPLWVGLVILFGKLFSVMQSRRVMGALTILSTIYSLIFSIGIFVQTALEKGFWYEKTFSFIDVAKFSFDVGIYIDGASAWMLLIVAIISLLVQIYSYSYMQFDKSFMRYFAYMNLFNFSMYGLILSPNMFQMYIFWELVGVTSYLLIGFWYKKSSVSIASKKAFIINRIGDCSLLAGIILSSYIILFNMLNINAITLPFLNMPDISAQIYGCTSDLIFVLICILLLVGAVAKSAQFPLNTWLIDAMQGPTPVSALIHSATMVAAGVFLLVRLYPLFSLSPVIMTTISVIGIITAIICSFAAITQTDIKKILAYSTNAQLGLMFLAIGACSTTVALIHLTSHAFIKSMLFLASGTAIAAMAGNKDIRYAGGLRKHLPTTAITFLVGIFSLSGLLFAGFSSKELILGNLLESHSYVYAVLFLIVAFMTAYYLFRLYFYMFEGEYRSSVKIKTVDFNLILIPAILSLIVIVLWFILPKFENILFTVISYVIAIFGIFAAYVVYSQRNLLKKLPLIYDISYNAFYLDDVCLFIGRVYKNISKMFYLIEKFVFDGISYFCVLNTRLVALLFSKLQTGNVQAYISYSLFILTLCFGGIMLVYSLIMYFSEVN